MIIKTINLLNSGSKALNVDGSSPVTFSFTANDYTLILGLSCILKDEGATSLNKFGSSNALTNGLVLSCTTSNGKTTMTTIKDNADLCTRFPINQFGNSSVLSVLGVSTPQGFGNSNNIFMGYMDFTTPHWIMLEAGDSIECTVYDNLTSIDTLEIAIKYCEG